MALFKISRGMAANLPKTYHEGYCYFTVDDGKFYIDTTDDASGRIVLNAARADSDRLNNIIDETYITDEELGEIIDGVPAPINADTLGGKLASDYVLKTDKVSVNYDQITMPDGSIWDGVAAVTTDTELSEESDNPVANRVITTALDNVDDKISNIKKLTSDSREGETSISAVPIDADKLGGIAASEYAMKSDLEDIGSSLYANLADNSDFTRWVAQAGIGGNHGTQAYGGDRWILTDGTITGEENIDGDGYRNITLNGTLVQVVPSPPAAATAFVEMVSGTAEISYDASVGEIILTSAGGVIKNVLLLDGDWTEKPDYVSNSYASELKRCMWYYQIIPKMTYIAGATTSATRFIARRDIQPMRIAPEVVSFSGAEASVYTESHSRTGTDYSITPSTRTNFLGLVIDYESGSFTSYKSGVFFVDTPIRLNADLPRR